MAVQFGYDIPECLSQNIIGGILVSGRCFYANCPQGKKFYAKTEHQLKKILICKIRKLKKLCPNGYPDNSLWQICIYG